MLRGLIPFVLLALVLVALPARADVARGQYLALAGDCKSCHTRLGRPAFGGGRELKTPFGAIYATNISPDRTYGIGAYSLADFDRAVRHGVARDGHHLYPAMPYPSFRQMSDQDLRDLYDYFLHGVPPVHEAGPKTNLPFPFNQRWLLMFWNWIFKPHRLFSAQPQHDAAWNRGAYLVETLGHCGACHTPRGLAYEERGMSATSATYLTGGTLEFWRAPTLRESPRSGLADWSEPQIAAFLKTGRTRNVMAFGAMSEVVEASTQYLTDSDRAAVAHYLKSLPPGHGTLSPDYIATDKELPGAGRYAQYCGGCHGADGRGRPDVPALAGNPAVLTNDGASVVHMVLKGGRAPITPAAPEPAVMPGFEPRLNDREIAEVASYVRQAFGNHAPNVSPDTVNRARRTLRQDPVARLPVRSGAPVRRE